MHFNLYPALEHERMHSRNLLEKCNLDYKNVSKHNFIGTDRIEV